MAAPTTTDPRVAIGLDQLDAALKELRDVDVQWCDMGGGERASWSADWDQLMTAYLPLLDGHSRAGWLRPDQQARYVEILGKLRQGLPIIARLGLCRPPVSLGA